jgi:hypothetical protein
MQDLKNLLIQINLNLSLFCGYQSVKGTVAKDITLSDKVGRDLARRGKGDNLYLKVHLHEIFCFCFFSSKAPNRSPDSYPKFVLNIKSNSPRYSNYSSLCVDSVNVELIFCFKLHTIFQHFIVDIGPI